MALKERIKERPLYDTLIYYSVAMLLIVLCNILPAFKSGPCTPNLDFLSVFLVFLICCALIFVNGFKALTVDKRYWWSTGVHSFVVLICLISLKLAT